jgi:hypothetical protein
MKLMTRSFLAAISDMHFKALATACVAVVGIRSFVVLLETVLARG